MPRPLLISAFVWELDALVLNNDDASDAAYGTAIHVDDTGGTTNDRYMSSLSATVTPAGTLTDGALLTLRLSRKPVMPPIR